MVTKFESAFPIYSITASLYSLSDKVRRLSRFVDNPWALSGARSTLHTPHLTAKRVLLGLLMISLAEISIDWAKAAYQPRSQRVSN